jgi:hypothetical protein
LTTSSSLQAHASSSSSWGGFGIACIGMIEVTYRADPRVAILMIESTAVESEEHGNGYGGSGVRLIELDCARNAP